jgi:hypothetical protein
LAIVQARLLVNLVIRRALSAVLIGTTLLLILSAFRVGVDRGDDTRIALSARGYLVDAICGVLSVEKYGTGRYVCANAAWTDMYSVGLGKDQATLDRLGMTIAQWATNTTLINQGIKAVFGGPSRPSNGIDRALGWGMDSGYMDFVQFSFWVFGEKLESLYKGFYLLLAISATLFAIQFANRPVALLTLVGFAYAFFFLVDYAMVPLELNSNTSRLVSLLAIIPLLHTTFLAIEDEPPAAKTILLLIPQGFVMGAASDFRGLAYWTVIALVGTFSFFIAHRRWYLQFGWRDASSPCWPILVVIGCLAITVTFTMRQADPNIEKIGGMRSHTFWEPLYYDLQKHPDWNVKYGFIHQYKTADEVPWQAVQNYRDRHHLAGPMIIGQDYENYLRIVYLNFIRKHTWFLIQLKYYDFLLWVRFCTTYIKAMFQSFNISEIGFGAVILFAFLTINYNEPKLLRKIIVYLSCLCLFFILASGVIWAFILDPDLLGDMLILGMMVNLALVFWGLSAVGILAVRRALAVFAKPSNSGRL